MGARLPGNVNGRLCAVEAMCFERDATDGGFCMVCMRPSSQHILPSTPVILQKHFFHSCCGRSTVRGDGRHAKPLSLIHLNVVEER